MRKKSFDVILLFVLVLARVRIDTLVDALVARRPVETIQRIFGWLLPARSLGRLEDWMTDPLSLLLATLTFGLLIVYLGVDLIGARHLAGEKEYRLKRALVWLIVLSTVMAQTCFLILMRHQTGPASFTHDGGVIQTEETIKYILAGKNPYVEDYLDTPMAEWGLDHRTALYHYPYLPWTFIFSTPFHLFSHLLLGWYDQRFVYLLLFIITLALAARLTDDRRAALGLTMTLGLNPIMGNDIIYGQNDSFVLCWVVLALYFLRHEKPALSAVAFGLACASKPTAWLLAPFYLLYLLGNLPGQEESPLEKCRALSKGAALRVKVRTLLPQILPGLVVFILLVLPFALWNLDAMVDDLWRWSSGTADVPYQIRGWGFANLILALGLVESRLGYFPFWLFELLLGLPLLLFLLWRQIRDNTLQAMLYGYGFFLLVFFYFSRFLNENYLGYILACLALAYFIGCPEGCPETEETAHVP